MGWSLVLRYLLTTATEGIMTFLVDSHCHLASLTFEQTAKEKEKGRPHQGPNSVPEVLARARACGVTHMLSVACTIDDYQHMMKLIAPYDGIFNACGIHPLNLEEALNWQEDDLKACLTDSMCVALGETGLDYFYASDSREAQLDSFARQIDLACEVKKPLIIHARSAHHDTVELMRAHNARDCGGVMHCFCDEVEMARECLDMGFFISFSGITTFRAADNVREVLQYVPLDRMLVETDCPYLAPVPVRGIENEPAFVRYTLEYVADFKKIPPKEMAEITSRNFAECFHVTLAEPSNDNIPDKDISVYKLEPIFNKGWPS